jgi:hypothetical protein
MFKVFILTWTLLIVITLVSCGDRALYVPRTQPHNKETSIKNPDNGKDDSNEINNNIISSPTNEVDYSGYWYANNEYSGPDANLTIIQKDNDSVVFELGFLRIANFENISANIEGDIAKFTDNDNLISGTLEFTDIEILLSIDKSDFTYIEPQKITFVR